MPYQVLVDVDLPPEFPEMIDNRCDLHILDHGNVTENMFQNADALLTYGHMSVDGAFMDRMPNIKVISNFGVGVDHIDLSAAQERGIPVGNTPSMLDGATADMTFALLMAAARNIVIGDHYARSAQFTHYDPRILIGHEVTARVFIINFLRQTNRTVRTFERTAISNLGSKSGRDIFALLRHILRHNQFNIVAQSGSDHGISHPCISRGRIHNHFIFS